MSTYSYVQPATRKGGGFLFILIFFAVLMAIVMYTAYDHGWTMHGDDALQARNCLKNYGPWKTFQEPNGSIHLLCKYPGKDKVFDVIKKLENGEWREATAMSPKDGLWKAIQNWLIGKGGHFLDMPPNGIPY
jgi:hypothetical protein